MLPKTLQLFVLCCFLLLDGYVCDKCTSMNIGEQRALVHSGQTLSMLLAETSQTTEHKYCK